MLGVRIGDVRKALQNVHELVAPFTATYVDDDIGVCPVGDLLLHHGLAGTERTRNRSLAALRPGGNGHGTEDGKRRAQARRVLDPEAGAGFASYCASGQRTSMLFSRRSGRLRRSRVTTTPQESANGYSRLGVQALRSG